MNAELESQPAAAAVPEDKVLAAFVHYYNPPEQTDAAAGSEQLADLLRKLPSLSLEEHVDTIHVQLGKHHPGISLTREHHALITFVDEAFTQMLKRTDLDFRVESFVRDLAPLVAAIAVEENFHAITGKQHLFTLMDTLLEECIGWSEDLGVLGEQFMEKITVVITGLTSGRASVTQAIKALKKHFDKEAPLHTKLEKRLCDRELETLAGKKGQFYSAELLNREMTGQKLPLFIIFMLQGPWYEFIRQVFIQFGEDSKEWQNAGKITEALIWSLQPRKDKAKQQSVMGSVPQNIRKLCQKASFNTDAVLASLADVEEEYNALRRNTPSDPCDFELLETDQSLAQALQAATPEAVERIRKVQPGEWYLYDDKNEPDEKVARVKLILNWHETEQLLLTNHNRRKVIDMTYTEMINHLGSGVLKNLNLHSTTPDAIASHLTFVLKAVSDQNKKEKQIEELKRRRAESVSYQKRRKEDLVMELRRLQKRAKVKKQRALVLRHKAEKKQTLAKNMVSSLRQDAWVKLPVMEGTLTPCKLVAIIPGNDNYIFANRAGLKVAEYTGGQLAHMIVTENSEILDTGAEFESALATVVSGLREDKGKSYDELTGDTG